VSVTSQSLATAQENAREARTRLAETVSEIRGRLQPNVLAREGMDRLRERGNALVHDAGDAARERPAVVGSAVGAALLLILRKPIARLIGRLFLKRDETEGPAAS
jgi:ElaB/YqjD/DUF883 family membrane-anchored ribosome-binding protein